MMSVSVVIPAHNEEANIEAIYRRLLTALPVADLEIIFVDDGSRDRTLACIQALRAKDNRVKYISMYTNYGHQKALIAGMRAASKELVFSLDCDLQHPPEFFNDFYQVLTSQNVDVVSGKRKNKQAGLLKQPLSSLFYKVFAMTTGVSITPGVSDFRLCTKRAAEMICSIHEPDPFVRGMISQLRIRSAFVDYDMAARVAGVPSYTFKKSLNLATQSLLRFSEAPIRIGLFFGTLGVFVAIGEGIHYTYLRLFTKELVPGQAELMVFLSLLGSLILVLLSLLLRYTRQLLAASRKDPPYVIGQQQI